MFEGGTPAEKSAEHELGPQQAVNLKAAAGCRIPRWARPHDLESCEVLWTAEACCRFQQGSPAALQYRMVLSKAHQAKGEEIKRTVPKHLAAVSAY